MGLEFAEGFGVGQAHGFKVVFEDLDGVGGGADGCSERVDVAAEVADFAAVGFYVAVEGVEAVDLPLELFGVGVESGGGFGDFFFGGAFVFSD